MVVYIDTFRRIAPQKHGQVRVGPQRLINESLKGIPQQTQSVTIQQNQRPKPKKVSF